MDYSLFIMRQLIDICPKMLQQYFNNAMISSCCSQMNSLRTQMGISILDHLFLKLILSCELLSQVQQNMECLFVAHKLQDTHIVFESEIDVFFFRNFAILESIKVVIFNVLSYCIYPGLIVVHIANFSLLRCDNFHYFIRFFLLRWGWTNMAAVVLCMSRSGER